MSTNNYTIGIITDKPVTRFNILTNEPDSRDVYQFSTIDTSNINLTLTGISSGDDADVKLYRDNGNGFFDSNDVRLSNSSAGSNQDEAINVQVNAGTYFAEVERYSPGSIGTVEYYLDLSATSIFSPSNLIPKEIVVGDLSGDITRSGFINNFNTTDVYSFSLGLLENVNLSLTGLSADADLLLYQDYNNDALVNTGELVRSSTSGGITPEFISGINSSGDYFVMVSQYGSSSTSYSLNFDYSITTFA